MAKKRKTYAEVEWTPEDVRSLNNNLSLSEAEEWLIDNEKSIQDRLTELGWNVIEDLLNENK